MPKSTLSKLLCPLLLLSGGLLHAEVRPAAPAPGEAVLTIRMFDYAGVPAETLLPAAETARKIYVRSGVETRWIRCGTRPAEGILHPACVERPGPHVIQMRLTPRVPNEMASLGPEIYGFALPARGEGFGIVATIFWGRVTRAAGFKRVSQADLLGCVMAHEVGHLLLGHNSHSSAGLMSGAWRRAEFQKIAEGAFEFIGSQKKTVRQQVGARLAAASEMSRRH